MYAHRMELKVWVEGIQRVICGVTESTTCQDVVIALAHATGKTGRFTLVERWRDNERLLAPTEPPLRVLHKWGEYACDVQFILRHSDKERRKSGSGSGTGSGSGSGSHSRGGGGGGGGGGSLDHGCSRRTEKFLHNFSPHAHQQQRRASGSGIRKSLTFSGAHTFFPPVKSPASSSSSLPAVSASGSVVPVPSPQATSTPNTSVATAGGAARNPGAENSSLESLDEQQLSSASFSSSSSPYASLDKQRRQYATAAVAGRGGGLERPGQRRPSPRHSPRPGGGAAGTEHPHRTAAVPSSPHKDSGHSQAADLLLLHASNNNNNVAKVSALHPNLEEYNLEHALKATAHARQASRGGNDVTKHNGTLPEAEVIDANMASPKKDELMRLVRLQQERLGVQDSQIKILDSEIQYWEGREQDFAQQYRTVREETTRLQQTERSLDDSLQELDMVSWADKLEIEKQQEKMLQSELTLVRSQIANAESELLAANSKMAQVSVELEEERRRMLSREQENNEQEMKMLQEIADLQKQINKKLLQHEQNAGSLDQLAAEVKALESAILEKKTQIADWEKELKVVNMNFFVQAPSTDWLQPPHAADPSKDKSFGRISPSRPGSSRKMMHNPQLLKETVATTKNPHGMWV